MKKSLALLLALGLAPVAHAQVPIQPNAMPLVTNIARGAAPPTGTPTGKFFKDSKIWTSVTWADITGTPAVSGGAINNTTIGLTTPAAGTFTALNATSGALNGIVLGAATPAAGTFTALNATSGALNGIVLGAATPAAGKFTTLTTTSDATINGGLSVISSTNAKVLLTNLVDGTDWPGFRANAGLNMTAFFIDVQRKGKGRWRLEIGDGIPESGSNSGSNLGFYPQADDGSEIGQAFGISRATGLTSIYKGLTVTGLTTLSGGGAFSGTITGAHTYSGALTLSAAGTALTVTNNAAIGGVLTLSGGGSALSVTNSASIGNALTVTNGATAGSLTAGTNAATGALVVNGPLGSNRNLRWYTAGQVRAQFTLNTTGESGGNVGSDLDLILFDDSGAANFNPAMRVTRSTGGWWFYKGIGVSLGVVISAVATSALPTCNAGNKGMHHSVTDATSPTYNGTLVGGGAVSVPVYCNGTAWTTH